MEEREREGEWESERERAREREREREEGIKKEKQEKTFMSVTFLPWGAWSPLLF